MLKEKIKKRTRWMVIVPLLVLAAVLVLFRFVFLLGYVPTASMEPAIPSGSVIIGYRLYDELALGDVVVFKGEDGRTLVKRIAAGPNERTPEGEVVPEDYYYLLGDNAAASIDSRCWDSPYINRDQILATLMQVF